MVYTNSSLVSYTKLSPNHSGQRTHSIDRITPHCVVGQCSVETLGNIFLPTSRQASSNYGIGVDGRVGMYVEEKNRSWCSSSAANDQRAVTIECASDNTEPYAFKDVVYQRLIELCTDICRRNGKTKLLWLGDKTKTLNYTPKSDEMVLSVHRWFANKSCPGNWMYARMGDLASKVTAALGGDVKPAEPAKPTRSIKVGDLVTITGSTYYNGKAIPGWVKKLRWYVVEVSGDRTVINKDESGRYAIMSPVKCETPHLDEETIKARFVTALNAIIESKDNILEDCRLMQATLTDCTGIDTEIESLLEEIDVVIELTKRCIAENSQMAQNQEEYAARYNGFVERYEKAKARLEQLRTTKAAREAQAEAIGAFMFEVQELDALTEFDEKLWLTIIDTITVHADGRMTFKFQGGTEIEA